MKNKIQQPQPLNPPATEAETERASVIGTAAQDIMCKRGFARHLWGNQSQAARDFCILMLRETDQPTSAETGTTKRDNNDE